MSEVKVNKISPRSGTDVTLGDSGDTIIVPAGVTFDSSAATTTLPATVVTTTGTQTLTNKSIATTQLTGTVATSNLGTGTASSSTFLRGDQTYAAAGGGLQSIQTFTSSGTYTRPAGITKIKVYITGGGGGGAGCSSSYAPAAGGGGGGGGTAIELIDASGTFADVTVTIGTGGAGTTDSQSGDGTTSSFGAYCSATGGSGNKPANNITNPSFGGGGLGAGGTINLDGDSGQGGNAEASSPKTGGKGGASFWGGGGQGQTGNGGSGGYYGGGGGGTCSNQPSTTRGGGAGGTGLCIVEEYA